MARGCCRYFLCLSINHSVVPLSQSNAAADEESGPSWKSPCVVIITDISITATVNPMASSSVTHVPVAFVDNSSVSFTRYLPDISVVYI